MKIQQKHLILRLKAAQKILQIANYIIPVSYTHLDVYKRQPISGPEPTRHCAKASFALNVKIIKIKNFIGRILNPLIYIGDIYYKCGNKKSKTKIMN